MFVGQGGTNFVDSISGTSTSTINAGQTVQWQWAQGVGPHSTTSGTCDTNSCFPGPVGGPPPLNWDSGNIIGGTGGSTFNQIYVNPGVYTYHCKVHNVMMQGTVNVLP